VFMNGLLLDLTVDYTSNGSAVTLTSGAAAGDEIEVVAYNTFSVGDALNQAAADTRYVNTAGDTLTGNLGVNVSPTAALDVRRSDADGKIAEFHQNGGYGFELSSSQTEARFRSGYLQAMSITTDAGSGAAEQMRISKEGYITTPNQPAFNATRTSSQGISGATTLVFNSVRSNIYNLYNSSNGIVTAPVAGQYLFTFKSLFYSFSNSEYLDLYSYVNSSIRNRYEQTGNSGFHTQANYAEIVYLNTNDTFKLVANDRSTGSYSMYAAENHFSGRLLG